MSYDDRINEFFNDKAFLVLSFVTMVLTALLAATSGEVPMPENGQGIFFVTSSSFLDSPVWSAVVNVMVIALIGGLMLVLNKVFNFVRSVTYILASSFFVLTMANPLSSSAFNTGTPLTMLLVLCTFALFSSYQDKRAQRGIFLTFTVITSCSMFQWAFLLLLPAFFLGYCYMRAMNFKGVIAALLGIFVPFWITLGLGIVKPYSFHAPNIEAVWDTLEITQVRALLISVALLALVSIVITVANLVKIFNYRLQLRVYNAFFMLVTIMTIVAMCVDYRDMQVYVPMLNLCLSVQIAHAFTIYKASKRYISVVILLLWAVVSYAAILFL